MSGISRRAHLTLWVLASAVFAATLGNMLVPGVLPGYAAQTGIDIAIVGRSNAVFGLTYAIAAPVIAAAVRRLSPYHVMLVALPLEAVTMLAVSHADTSTALDLARVAQAITVAGVVPMCTVHAGSIVPPSLRSRALSISFGGMVLASLVGAPLGNVLADSIGARESFLVVGALLVGVWLVALSARRWQQGLRAAATAAHQRNAVATGVTAAVVVILGAVLGTAMLEGAATSGLNTFVSPFLTDAVGAEGTTLSLLLLCYGIAGLAGNALLGAVADRWGPARVLVGTTLAAAVAVAGLTVVTTPPAAALFLLGWGFCSWAINPPLQALIIAHAGSRVNLLVAVNSSVIFTGSSLGTAIASTQVDDGGLAALPLVSAGIFVLSSATAAVAWIAVVRLQRTATSGASEVVEAR